MAGNTSKKAKTRSPLGNKIYQLRVGLHLKQEEVAELLGLKGVKQYQRYESSVEPDSDKLALLSDKFKYDLFGLVRNEAYRRNNISIFNLDPEAKVPVPDQPNPLEDLKMIQEAAARLEASLKKKETEGQDRQAATVKLVKKIKKDSGRDKRT
jgi:transcriptional regulator with XRE-family HTH domain